MAATCASRVLVEIFARDMGYMINTLPKHLVREGQERPLVTTEFPPYFQLGSADKAFGKNIAKRNRNVPGGCERIDGYAVHALAYRKRFGYSQPIGLLADQSINA